MNERKQKNDRGAILRSPMLLSLLALGAVFFVLLGVKALKDKQPAETDPAVPADASASLPAPDTTRAPEIQTTAPETDAPVTTAEAPVVTTTEPAPTEPPQVMMTVDDRYFADALFIGDSRTDGLRLYSPPGESKFYCGTSMNIFKVMDSDFECCGFTGLRNLLRGRQFGKIYIMFGINECGYPTSSFASTYREVVEEIREYQPEALIYLQSICYVSQNKEAKDPVFSTENLKEKNETIKALANDTDIFYLEVNDCMNDGTDHLPSEYTGDGVHLKAAYYSLWHDYLLAHAVVDGKHPWEPESEDTTEAEGAAVEHP